MYDERKLHVKPWHRGQRRQVYGRWPTVAGWASILSLVIGPTILFWEIACLVAFMVGLKIIYFLTL
jgi:hypothetical protein